MTFNDDWKLATFYDPSRNCKNEIRTYFYTFKRHNDLVIC